MEDWRIGKPYRPNVGVCLINRDGLVWFGKCESSGPELVEPGREWQMPQGGIEEAEDIVEAAKRELWEETGVKTASFLAVTDQWSSYDFPFEYQETEHFRKHGQKLDMFRGQKQKWVAFRFFGDDAEVDISARHTGEPQEFFAWEWLSPSTALKQTTAHKTHQYRLVFQQFSEFLAE